MRTILFRGKRKSDPLKLDGEWIEGLLSSVAGRGATIRTVESKQEISVEQETVGQYTGLDNKNGKRVFEGDIMEYKDANVKVGFSNGCFNVEDKYGSKYLISIIRSRECIGNIHDNPELLEEEK
jgi:hypothetical protein